jgi:hypothetical protein
MYVQEIRSLRDVNKTLHGANNVLSVRADHVQNSLKSKICFLVKILL